MKKGNVEQVKRTSYLLELGIDFQVDDLEVIASNGINKLRSLNKDFTDKFYELNIGKWVFCGNYDEETKTVLVKTEEELFI